MKYNGQTFNNVDEFLETMSDPARMVPEEANVVYLYAIALQLQEIRAQNRVLIEAFTKADIKDPDIRAGVIRAALDRAKA